MTDVYEGSGRQRAKFPRERAEAAPWSGALETRGHGGTARQNAKARQRTKAPVHASPGVTRRAVRGGTPARRTGAARLGSLGRGEARRGAGRKAHPRKHKAQGRQEGATALRRAHGEARGQREAQHRLELWREGARARGARGAARRRPAPSHQAQGSPQAKNDPLAGRGKRTADGGTALGGLGCGAMRRGKEGGARAEGIARMRRPHAQSKINMAAGVQTRPHLPPKLSSADEAAKSAQRVKPRGANALRTTPARGAEARGRTRRHDIQPPARPSS